MQRSVWWRTCMLAAASALLVSTADAAEQIAIDGSTGVRPLVEALARAYLAREPASTVSIGKGLGTKERIQALADDKIQIPMASHGIDVDEIRRLGMRVHPIAKVPVVFAVNGSVDVTGIREAHVCDIFAGRILNWNALSGADHPLVAMTRPDSEVDTQVVRERLPCLTHLKMADTVKVMWKAGEVA